MIEDDKPARTRPDCAIFMNWERDQQQRASVMECGGEFEGDRANEDTALGSRTAFDDIPRPV